jgi:hypothetical protein
LTTDMRATQEQLQQILGGLQATPYETVDAALAAQLRAVDAWSETVRDNPALSAMAGVMRAQLQASQRMLDVTKRESEQVAQSMRQAARALGVPVQ